VGLERGDQVLIAAISGPTPKIVIIGRFAGFIAKYMGDGVLVYFGYPEAHEDDAVRQYRALPLPVACSWHRISFGPCTRQ
jgi:hypothetical protein